MNMLSHANQIEAARHVDGATITMGDGSHFDCAEPETTPVDIVCYAYAQAFTVRFRGQTKLNGEHVFYGVGEHNVRGAEQLLIEGYARADALAFLFHESGELPFGDLPGPAKSLFPGWREHEKRTGWAINAHFGIETPDPDLIKRFDIRMYLTEKRDLMPRGIEGIQITPGYEPFAARIVPFDHPKIAAEKFLRLLRVLRREA
jgi:hypothetical protein